MPGGGIGGSGPGGGMGPGGGGGIGGFGPRGPRGPKGGNSHRLCRFSQGRMHMPLSGVTFFSSEPASTSAKQVIAIKSSKINNFATMFSIFCCLFEKTEIFLYPIYPIWSLRKDCSNFCGVIR